MYTGQQIMLQPRLRDQCLSFQLRDGTGSQSSLLFLMLEEIRYVKNVSFESTRVIYRYEKAQR